MSFCGARGTKIAHLLHVCFNRKVVESACVNEAEQRSIRVREYGYIYHGTRSREVHTSSEALVRQSHAPQICSSRSWLWPTPCAFRTSSAHRRPLTTPSSRPCPDVPLWTRTTDRRPHTVHLVCVRTRRRSSSANPPLFRRRLKLGTSSSLHRHCS